MNNYISKKDLKEAYKKMEEEPLVLPPKAYKELQKIILENKQLKEENKQLKIENAYYKSKVLGGNSQLQELKGKIEILGDKE